MSPSRRLPPHHPRAIAGATVGYDYDPAGRLTTERYGTGGGTRTYGYDNLGRLRDDTIKNPSATTVASIGYGYDLNSRMTSKTTTGTAGAATNQYGYDLAGRLTNWNNGTTVTAYTWDAAGNRTSAGGTASSFDERNELLNDGTTTYSYSARGTLTGSTAQGSQPKDVQFDGFDRMVKEGPSTYSYDSTDRVAQAGNTTFTYDGGSNNVVTDGTATYTRTPGGRLLGTAATGATPNPRLVISDQHTDVVATIDPTAKGVTGSTAYDPFGKPTASAGATNSLGYQSGWTDPASGDVNMAARWYRPGSGTFASRDSWQLGTNPSIQGNRFTYGNGDPSDSTDPSGHNSCETLRHFAPLRIPLVCIPDRPISLPTYDPEDFQGGFSGGPQINCDKYWWTTDCGGAGFRPTPTSTSELHRGITSTSELNRISRGGGSGDGGRSNPAPHHRRPRPHTPSGPTLPRPKPPTDTRPINDNDRPHIDPSPIDFFTDTIVTVGTAVLTAVAVEGAPVVVGTAVEVGAGVVAGTDALIDLADDLLAEPEPKPIPGPRPGDPGGEDKRRGQGCQRDGAGWVDYGPVDVGNGGRATGVTACLDSAYLDSHEGTKTDVKNGIKPAGYDWARKQVAYWGGRTKDVNACHLLADQLSGSGTNLANLVTCGTDANSYVGKKKSSGSDPGPMDSMLTFEDKVKKQVDRGNTVLYQVTPHYEGNRNVPYEIEMSYIAWNKDGHLIGADHDKTPNLIYTAGSGWKNLGSSIHSGTGQDAGQYGD